MTNSMNNFQLNKRSNGMTLLEVLIAIMLFAVFTGVFLTVTEMLSVLIPPSNTPLGDQSCNGAALELSCINIAFDQIIPILEKDNDNIINGESTDKIMLGCSRDAGSIPAVAKEVAKKSLVLDWPDEYKVCIYNYDRLEEKEPPVDPFPLPGLYLLQAEPTKQVFWRKPVQRLFCRPYHLCIDP